MTTRPTDQEIASRIEALLMTRRAGQAVSDRLEGERIAWAHRALVADLRLRRFAHVAERTAYRTPDGHWITALPGRVRPI